VTGGGMAGGIVAASAYGVSGAYGSVAKAA